MCYRVICSMTGITLYLLVGKIQLEQKSFSKRRQAVAVSSEIKNQCCINQYNGNIDLNDWSSLLKLKYLFRYANIVQKGYLNKLLFFFFLFKMERGLGNLHQKHSVDVFFLLSGYHFSDPCEHEGLQMCFPVWSSAECRDCVHGTHSWRWSNLRCKAKCLRGSQWIFHRKIWYDQRVHSACLWNMSTASLKAPGQLTAAVSLCTIPCLLGVLDFIMRHFGYINIFIACGWTSLLTLQAMKMTGAPASQK